MSGRAHGLLGRRWVETRKSSAADANGDVGGCGIEKEEEGAGGSACTRRTSAGEGTAGHGHAEARQSSALASARERNKRVGNHMREQSGSSSTWVGRSDSLHCHCTVAGASIKNNWTRHSLSHESAHKGVFWIQTFSQENCCGVEPGAERL